MSEPKRMHPVAALTGLLGALREFAVPIVFVYFLGRDDSHFEWFLAAALILPFTFSIARWMRFTYHLAGNELVVNEGVLIRKKTTIPRNRVQSVDISARILQRIFGLVSVQIRTAGGNDSKVELSAVTNQDAEAIVAALRGGEIQSTESTKVESGQAVYTLGGKNLVLTGVTSGQIGVILSIVATALSQFDDFIDFEKIEDLYGTWAPFLADSLIGLFLFVFVATWIFSILGTMITYFDFRLSVDDRELKVRYGLFNQKKVSIPFRRIQAVRYTEGLLRQPFGFGALYVESAGEGDQKQQSSCIVAPFIHKSEVPNLIEAIQPELNFEMSWEKPPTRARSKYILRLLRPAALLIAVAFFLIPLPYAWLSLVMIPLCGWLGNAQFQTEAFAISENRLRLRTRFLARNTVTIKRNRVQSAIFTTNWFLHRRDLWSFQILLASLGKNLRYGISYLGSEQEPLFRNWVNDGLRKARVEPMAIEQPVPSSDSSAADAPAL